MSFIDYSQTAEDHQSLLVLVRHTGTHLSNQNFSAAWEHVKKLSCIHVQGQKRNVYVRYKRGYPKENNAWGDYQTHRKVLGLVSIGRCSSVKEFEDLFEDYKKIKDEYANTIYNSRLIVFGMNTDGTPIEKESEINSNTNSSSGKEEINCDRGNGSVVTDKRNGQINKDNKILDSNHKEIEKRPHSNSLTKESTGAEVVFYPNLETMTDLEERLREFITSLFYVLEGKRLDRSFERADRLQLLCAPFEKKDFVGVDTDTRTFKKKCTGRLRKHLADLCLQAGMPGEAILHYQTAIDLLRSVNDFLWIGGCFEGLSSSSVIMAYPKMATNAASIKRNLSFTDKRAATLVNEKTSRTATLSNNYANGLDLAEVAGSNPGLNPDDIIEKYREAITHYSKFKSAGMIEMEASLKACRVLIGQRKYLQASDFLQNVVYINLPSSEEDKIQRFGTLATLYSQIGFHRKAAFFKRVAGMQCVSPGTAAWHQCYYLLLETLQGYKITLDPKHDNFDGWPMLHHRILTELVYAARRMGNPQLAVRHMSFLLHTMFDHLSPADRREAINGLVSLTSKCEGSSQAISLDNGHILPPVPLTKFPLVKSFTLMNLPPHLQPLQIDKRENPDKPSTKNIFIFTPIKADKPANTSLTQTDFVWVSDEMCEVQLQVVNPMPDELKISYMGLLTEGVDVEIFPSNPSIPSESKPCLVKLMCKPKNVGEMKILGYCTHVLGVNSKCYLHDLPLLQKTPFTVQIIPPLPQISLKSSLPKSASFTSLGEGVNVVASASVSLFAGQSQECMITLQNTGVLSVSQLSVILDSKPEMKEFLQNVFSWSDDNISSQLPLLPTTTLCFSVCLYGYSDFMSPECSSSGLPSPVFSNRSRSDSSENRLSEALLTVEYSGDVGFKAGYCRQCSLAVTVDILPSLHIVSWDVQPAESSDKCVVLFDLQNVTNHQIEIQYSDDNALIIEPQQTRRIALPISKIEFPVEPVELEEVFNVNNPVWSTVKTTNHYSSYLANFIDIRWSMSATKVQGNVCIDHIIWSESQLELLQISSIRWEVRLNDQLYLCPDVPKFTTGDLVQIKTTIFNDTGGDCRDVILSIHVSQCCDQSTDLISNTSLSDSIALIDSNIAVYKQLSEKDSAVIVCAFIFFCPGLFTLDISCCFTNSDLHKQTWRCIPMPKVLIED